MSASYARVRMRSSCICAHFVRTPCAHAQYMHIICACAHAQFLHVICACAHAQYMHIIRACAHAQYMRIIRARAYAQYDPRETHLIAYREALCDRQGPLAEEKEKTQRLRLMEGEKWIHITEENGIVSCHHYPRNKVYSR